MAVKEPTALKSCMGTIEFDVGVTGDVGDAGIETILNRCKYSPVHGLMAEAIEISGDVVRAWPPSVLRLLAAGICVSPCDMVFTIQGWS